MIDHHAEAVEELDVEGILAFAERILPRASDFWGQASLDYRQRLQHCCSPKKSRTTEIDSIEPSQRHHFSGNWSRPESADEKMVTLTFAGWNQIAGWLRRLDGLRGAA